MSNVVGVNLRIDPSLPEEARQIIYREFIRAFLTPGTCTFLCQAHAALHPDLNYDAQDEAKRPCVLCGAGLKETEGLSSL